MAGKKLALTLRGHHEGKTVKLSGMQFTKGRIVLAGAEEEVNSLAKYLFRCYQAVPEHLPWPPKKGTEEYGPSEIYQEEGSGEAATVDSGVQPDGTGPEEVSTDKGTGADGTEGNGAGDLPNGGGHEDAGSDTAEAGFNNTTHAVNPEKLLKAMQCLDHANPDHWTKDGKPRMDAVEGYYGSAGITRADLNAVWPELSRAK